MATAQRLVQSGRARWRCTRAPARPHRPPRRPSSQGKRTLEFVDDPKSVIHEDVAGSCEPPWIRLRSIFNTITLIQNCNLCVLCFLNSWHRILVFPLHS